MKENVRQGERERRERQTDRDRQTDRETEREPTTKEKLKLINCIIFISQINKDACE